MWRYFETKQYKRIKESQEYITEVATKYIKEARNHPDSLVHAYEVGNELNSKDIATLVSDFLLAGIDTSANSMAFLLHEVAKHKDVQDDLTRYHDVQRLDHELNENALKSFKLGKAIIKESLRLHPISVGVGRNLGEDAIFSGTYIDKCDKLRCTYPLKFHLLGYHIPKGTLVVTQNQISCRLEQFCPVKPHEFWPYRYLNEGQRLHPYLSLPFGFGPRMCIGRRLAEMSMQILLYRISQNLYVKDLMTEKVDCISLLINQPDRPIRLKFNKK